MEPALDFIGIMIMLTHVLNSYCMPAVIRNWNLFTKSCPTVLWPHGLQLAKLLCPWNSLDKNTGVGSHSFLQGSPYMHKILLKTPLVVSPLPHQPHFHEGLNLESQPCIPSLVFFFRLCWVFTAVRELLSLPVTCRLSCLVACGILFPDQGSVLRPLCWKVDS